MMIESLLTFLQAIIHDFPTVRAQLNGIAFTILERTFVNSVGVHQQERRAFYDFQTMFGGIDGEKVTSFNYVGTTSYELNEQWLEHGIVRRVFTEAARSFDARPVPEKFVGDVIVTPECLGSLLMYMIMEMTGGALTGYGLLAKTSPYLEKKGQAIASTCFTLQNVPRLASLPKGSDFDGHGVPTRDIDVIKNGVLENFLIDAYTARKLGVAQTAGVNVPCVLAGSQPLEQLIAETKRGVLLARFSGGIPNAQLDYSGVAKNSFYIEDGKILFPLIETMTSWNMQQLLMNLRGVSQETVNFGDSIYPYIAASGVTISSK